MSPQDLAVLALLGLGAVLVVRLLRADAGFVVGSARYGTTAQLAADARILHGLETKTISDRLDDFELERRDGGRRLSVSFGWTVSPWRWRMMRRLVRFRLDVPPHVSLDAADARGMKGAIGRAFELGARRVYVWRKRLTIELPLDLLPLGRWGEVFPLLQGIVLELEHPGGLRVARSGGNVLCAYCHEAGELVACVGCRTLLHEGCWRELGRCPVLGCAGTERERARSVS